MIKKFIRAIVVFFLLGLAKIAVAADQTPTKLPNPLGEGVTDFNVVIQNVITVLLGLLGGAALLMFIWGGSQWLFSRGDTKMIASGKNTLIWAVLGLLLIFSAYLILNFIFSSLTSTPTA